MDVSVVIPTRNRSALFRIALASVLRQQGVDLEVIVVDEASTDDTPAVLAAISDPRVRVIRNERPHGLASARNIGLAQARGDWLAFLDDDDLWAPDKLARQLQAGRETERDWAYTGAVVIDAQNRLVRVQRPLPPDETVAALARYHAIPAGGSNVAVRREAWQQVGPFDVRLRSAEDWEFCIRLAKHGPPAYVCSPLVARRVHGSNMTLDIAETIRGTRLVENLHQTTADWGMLHRWMAHSCLRVGRRRAALGQFARAALHGHGWAVASDLRAMLRVPGKPVSQRASTPADDAWIAAATAWLRELQPSV